MVSNVIGVELPSGVDDTGTDASDEEGGGATTGEDETVVFETGGETPGRDEDEKAGVGDEAGGDETEGETTGIVTGAVPVAGTVTEPVFTEMFPVGIL